MQQLFAEPARHPGWPALPAQLDPSPVIPQKILCYVQPLKGCPVGIGVTQKKQ